MNAGHGELNPLRNIHSVVSDTFKIFCYHKKIESILAIGGIFGNHLNKCLFYTVKGIIHYIIVIGYRLGKLKILLNIGIDAYVKQDVALAKAVAEHDDVVDNAFGRMKDMLIKMISENKADGEYAVDLLMIAKYFERIGDHAVNIAEWVEFSVTGVHKGE